MSHQLTFADSEFSTKRRQTRKEIFLSRMEQILPWQNMVEVIEPFYPKAGNGRRPYPLETMLRIHCMQHWYNLSDGAMEDALYEIASMRLFARLSLDSALPDRTTIMNFRHLLEQHQLARQLFKTINRWLAEAGVMMTQGTLVDATIIEAPSSTKNKEQQRDPEMPDTDPAYKGADSLALLRHVSALIREKGWQVGNIDATVLAQAPKLAPHIVQMRERLAAAMECDVDRVSVKATTEEKLGFTGAKQGIAAHCVCLLEKL